MSRRSHDLHEEASELLGVYALNAADADERDLVDRHLPDCPKCRAELADHIFVATTLGNTGSDAPEGVWDRIIDEMEESPPRMRLDLPTSGPARVIPLDEARRARQRPKFLAAAAAVVVIGALGAQVVRQEDRIGDLQVALERSAVQDAATIALADPSSERVRLVSSDGELAASAVLLPSGSGYLLAADLPELASARTYQLWGKTSSGLVSLGLLGSEPNDVVAFEANEPVEALAITEERAGGVHQSTNPPVVIGQFD